MRPAGAPRVYFALFVNLSNADPGRWLYKLYIERIGQFRRDPPGKNWDGVFTHTSK